MADNASRRGASSLGMPLMILAFAVIGGFLYWLNGQASQEMAERQAYADSVAAAEEAERNRPPLIQAERIQMDATPFEGDAIRLANVPVASPLGQQGFWLEMPNGNPFLVSLSDEARAVAPSGVATGDLASLTGTVMPIGDSVLTAWTEAGTISDGDRLAAEFATHFIEATEFTVTAAAPEETDSVPGGGDQ